VLPREAQISQHVVSIAAYFAGVHPSHVESLQVVHYAPGQLYEPHTDALDGCDLSHRFYGGRRALTFIIYLNDLDDGDTGGSTRFPALGLNVRPLKNAALVFENYDAHGNEDPRTLHSGEPPKSSAKYAMNVWVRTAPWAAFAIGAAQH